LDYLNLKDKVVVITGGSRGIGECAALMFGQCGARVIILDLKDESGMNVSAKIREAGGDSSYKNCDVNDPARIKAVVDEIISEYGRIDILICNAGAGADRLKVEDITDEEWNRIMEVDMKSTFNMCREITPNMKRNRYGKIVISSSGSGVAGAAFNSHYAAARGAQIAFAKSLCFELAEFNITVNAIAIPSVVTPGSFEWDIDDDMDAELPEIPMRRLGTPEDVANMMLYLSSDVSSYVSGQAMAPNGGKR